MSGDMPHPTPLSKEIKKFQFFYFAALLTPASNIFHFSANLPL